ncbi:MAG: AMP-binding protein [Chromatiales bacterium]|jgi:non-ribosomal peptide synthetase component E (peptide arylation enzyme)|nr:AMP-binding protein [Chromatiales bacterium]
MSILQRYTRRDYERFYKSGFWTSDHLLEVVSAHAEAEPGKVAIVDGDSRVTRAELIVLVDNAASALQTEGIRGGDIVAVQLPNSLHLVVVCLALLKVGAIYHPINPSYRHNDILKIFSVSKPKFFIYTGTYRAFSYGEQVDALMREPALAFDARLVDVDRPIDEAFATADAPLAFEAPDPDAIYLIGTTSGSTGDPKLYMHTHNTQFNEARALNAEMGIGEADAFLGFAPITHRGVFMWGFVQAMAAGAPLVVERVYNPEDIIARIIAERVTSMFAIPTQVIDLLNVCEARGGGAESLRVLMMAGAPVQPELVLRIRRQWPNCAPVTGFGTSETGYAVITRPDYPIEHLQTCGKPLTGMEVNVDLSTASDGKSGELVLRGPFICAGYYANQPATDTAHDRDGWFHTGDLGYIDDDGNVMVTGRIKNVIIRSGLNIQAEEVEEILLRHDAIMHAVVVGKRDDRTGERAIAYLVMRGSKTLSLSEVVAFLEGEGMAKFKWPEGLVVMEELPVNAAGKFDRILLRRQLDDVS